MTDWTDANFTITSHQTYTPNKGPADGWYYYVWNAQWPLSSNSLTQTYLLNNVQGVKVTGFILDDPQADIDSKGDDVRYYVTPGWPSTYPTSPVASSCWVGNDLTMICRRQASDWLFAGPGNDRLRDGRRRCPRRSATT